MTQRHTPGPWHVVDGHTVIVIAKPGTILHNQIAKFHNFSTSFEQEANARLGAAAPELLEALKGILDHTLANQSPAGQQAVMIARAAIAKAEGRS